MTRSRPAITVLVAPESEDPSGLAALSERSELRVVRDLAELRAAVAGADVLAVYDFGTDLVHELGAPAGELDWIHAASAGVDAVLTPAVLAGDTVVTNAQGVFDDAIAEWVLAVLLLFTKDLLTTIELQRERRWLHRETQRLAGRRLLVVGAGSIGATVARSARALGMDVRGVARRARADGGAFDAVVGVERLHDELGWADDVVVAAPLTPDTRGLLDAAAFSAMRPGTRLVNVGRGPVVDEAALLDALESGRVGAAALDVVDQEPLPAEHPFWRLPQVLVSPHMSGDVEGWVDELSAQFCANVERWSAGAPLEHVVDKHRMAGAAT